MISFIQKTFRESLPVRPGEWGKVLLMFSYFFLVIATYYIVKPVRSSIFLDRLGPDKLPYVYMGEALLVGIVSFFYARFVDRHRKENILMASTVIFSACLFIFWFLFRFQVSWYAFLFYLWSAVFSVMAVTQFWLLANDLFNPREAKRLFGLIGSGGVLGAICGGFLTAQTVKWVGTENLLLVAGGIILLCLIFIRLACQKEPALDRPQDPAGEPAAAETKRSIGKLILASRYLILLMLLVGIGKVLSTFIDFQFQTIVDSNFPLKDSKTAYFGGFFAVLNGAAFLIQVFLTSRILRKWGVAVSLLLLPVILSFGMLSFAIFPVLLLASFTKFFDGSFNYSIQSAAKEILYLPIDRTVRHKIKPFIDMFIYRFAKGIGGFLILILMLLGGFGMRGLSLTALIFIGLWCFIVIALKREYIESLKKVISNCRTGLGRSVKPGTSISIEFLESLGDKEIHDLGREICKHSGHRCERAIAIAQLVLHEIDPGASRAQEFVRAFFKEEICWGASALSSDIPREEELDRLILEGIRGEKPVPPHEVTALSPAWHRKLETGLLNRSLPPSFRRKIIEILMIFDGKKARELLRRALEQPEDNLQYDLIMALSKLRGSSAEPLLDYAPLKDCLAQNVSRYSYLLFLETLYENRIPKKVPSDEKDRFLRIFASGRTELIERIFHLLSLYYPVEVIQLIRTRYQEGDPYVKAHAAELLDNVVGREIGRLLLPVLEDESRQIYHEGKWISKPSNEMIRTIFQEKEPWYILLLIFMILSLNMEEHFPKIQILQNDERASVREAAKLAWEQIQSQKGAA